MKLNEIKDLIRKAKRNNVATLDLSFKELTSLPPEIFELEMKDLTRLYISRNQLTSLPSEISELKKLKTLDLSRNQLTSLPSEISELKNLKIFDLSRNQLTSLPSEISELKNLTTLIISYNQLTSLPLEISELKNLTTLELSGNQLTSLPPEIAELKNLTTLYISGNQLTSLPPEISELKSLKTLEISDNQLTSLPAEISGLKNLTTFYISRNLLTSVPLEISELKNLRTLELSGNQLTSLSPKISELKNLKTLYIYDNQLTSLPPEISELNSLTSLYISRNQLTSLPPKILELFLDIRWEYQLGKKGIFLEGNPLENPPIEIVKQGREAVINYFKSLEDGKEHLNDVKVLLVGDGGAGKTSLVKRIFGEEVDKNEPQTHGINIRKLPVNNGDREIKANFWDFGGQQIMHATHQFFLSKRSLYILVLDGRKDEKPEYWLKLIENFGGDSPVLVVINKIDENPAFELNRKFLREKYPSIIGFYRLSCKSGKGINEFSKILEEELAKVKHLEIKWPKSWFNVKSKLEKMCPSCSYIEDNNDYEHCNFIEYKKYKIMCDEEGIRTESEQNTLVDFLHDLGVILHFKDVSLLNTHVLEPEWVTNAVYKIINSEDITESRGVLKLNMLPEILKQRNEGDFNYPPNQYGFIVSLMKKFELSYELDDQTVLLPSLLEIQEPDFEFDYKRTLKFIIDYDFLPPSVMPRFIVKMNRDIKNGLQWRTGVVLENKEFNSCAVIKSDNEAKRIYINVNGGQKRDYFSSMLFNLREINNSFEKLKAVEKIPLPDEPEISVGYDHLVYLEEIGEDRCRPEGSKKAYNVKDLLGTVKIRRTEQDRFKTEYERPGQTKEESNIVSILFLAADPTDESRRRLDEEFREIKEELKLAKLRDQFRLELPQLSVRSRDISQALLDTQPQIVHFSGHGTPTGELCFEDLVGKTHPVESDALAALFEQFRGQVDCVILNACYSEIQATAIAKHIKYVIGMNQAIGDKAAIAFAIGFYQALGGGRSIEGAYELGRVQVQLQNIPEHLTPVLIKKV